MTGGVASLSSSWRTSGGAVVSFVSADRLSSIPVTVGASSTRRTVRSLRADRRPRSSTTVTTSTSSADSSSPTTVETFPSVTLGIVTTTLPSTRSTVAPGVWTTRRPSLSPFARPCGSTTSEFAAPIETVTLRSGSGAGTGGGIGAAGRAVTVNPAATMTSSPSGASGVGGRSAATAPSVVWITVSGTPGSAPSWTPTRNSVPRTVAVVVGVRTSYLEPAVRSFVTACHV